MSLALHSFQLREKIGSMIQQHLRNRNDLYGIRIIVSYKQD